MTGLAADLAAAVDPARTFAAVVGSDPESWQRRVLYSTARRQLLLTARQVGKSTTAAVTAGHTALYKPGSTVLIVAPTERQSRETLAKVAVLLRQVAVVEGSRTELRTESGSRVVALPGEGDTIRGFSAVELLLLDEGAWIADTTFTSVLPMVAANGRVLALSTPGARVGWFYDAFTSGDSLWERHRVRALESARYTPAMLDELRRSLGGRQFRAEYACEFVGLTESAFDPDKVEAAFRADVRPLFGGVSS